MGECTYYLKAQFKNKSAATKARPKIKKFLKEAIKAYDYWQKHRGGDTSNTTFWRAFKTKFPTIYEYLKSAGLADGGKGNELSGTLDFGQCEDDIDNICLMDSAIGYVATNVWHFSDWSNLAAFITSKFGAVKTVWSSDEDGCGSLEGLQLYDYEGIVEVLLKKAETDDVLVLGIKGIHPDLDVFLNKIVS
jgi:hypothetical protein